ncbi:MAG: pyridoxal 5'-phosphate synthase glutaminase subunit PdxT [Acidimicrobiales bacterium]|nr:pyridoxal 5'-phosphate synthase glutaminase subunit PdxT [Acidimicrobiales bacterium]
MTRIGVLALQGAFRRHVEALEALGVTGVEVRAPADLDGIDGLILPGGESTAMSLLLGANELTEPCRDVIAGGLPVFGTCAGMILLAEKVLDGRSDQVQLSDVPITVRRNGYGRQLASFEADLEIAGETEPFRAVFIRAPKVEQVDPAVEVLATVDDDPVLIRYRNVLAAAFHPELTPDLRLHRVFLLEC